MSPKHLGSVCTARELFGTVCTLMALLPWVSCFLLGCIVPRIMTLVIERCRLRGGVKDRAGAREEEESNRTVLPDVSLFLM